jgi:uncharacterized protein (TIGR03067 family)
MRPSLCGLLVVGTILTAIASADDLKNEAIKRDRQQIAGKWQIVALEINGNKSKAEDAKKLTVVNTADGRWSLRSEGNEVSKGTSTLDPTKKPKTIDFTPTDGGGNGNKYLGIYELGENSRKLCFAPAESGRPTEFSAKTGSQNILVIFQRVKAE